MITFRGANALEQSYPINSPMSQSIRGGHLLHDYSKVLSLSSCLVHRNGRTFKWYEIFCVKGVRSTLISEEAAYPQSSDSLTLYNLIPSHHGRKAILLVPFLSVIFCICLNQQKCDYSVCSARHMPRFQNWRC